MLSTVYGLKIIINDRTYQVFDRKRTLSERLFTFPWSQFKTELFRQEMEIKNGQVIRFGDNITMNSQTLKALEPHIKEKQHSFYPVIVPYS